jgi:hypothetical protein
METDKMIFLLDERRSNKLKKLDLHAFFVAISRVRRSADLRYIGSRNGIQYLTKFEWPTELLHFLSGYDDDGHWQPALVHEKERIRLAREHQRFRQYKYKNGSIFRPLGNRKLNRKELQQTCRTY